MFEGVTPQARSALDALFASYGSSLPIISAYRDPQTNARVGGARGSQHLHGNAFDFDVSGIPFDERLRIADLARAAGFQGFGFYDNSMHFDVGPSRAWGPDYSSASIPSWASDWTSQNIGVGAIPAAPAMSTRGAAMESTQEPRGLLEFMGIQRRDPSATDETALPFYQRERFSDFMGALALGLNELRQRPSQAIPQMMRQRQEMREREEQRREEQQRNNATVQWLASRPGGAAFAQLIEAGAEPSQALSAYLDSARRGVEAPRVETILTPEGGEVAVQWDESAGQWVPLNAPEGAIPRPPDRSESENRLALFGSLQTSTQPFIDQVEEAYDPANIQDAAARRVPLVGNFFQSEVGQQYEAAARAWAEGALRLQTGAAATQDEIDRLTDTYFARPGDTPSTIALKRNLRNAFTNTILGLTGNLGVSVEPLAAPGAQGGTRSIEDTVSELENLLGQ